MRASEGKIAIYSRKSKFTGKGESIGNQIELCREYIRANHGQADADAAAVYEDEGFSGGNLERPAFKRMLRAARERKFKAVVVYRLDRISRNISDFSGLIEELSRLDIAFVSIKEQFDTGTPMGRAMDGDGGRKSKKSVYAGADPGGGGNRKAGLRAVCRNALPYRDGDGAAAAGCDYEKRKNIHTLFHQGDSAKSRLSGCRSGSLPVFYTTAGRCVFK